MNPIPVIFQWTGSVHKSNLQTERATSSLLPPSPPTCASSSTAVSESSTFFSAIYSFNPPKMQNLLFLTHFSPPPCVKNCNLPVLIERSGMVVKILTFLSGVQELYIFSVHECFWHMISLEDKELLGKDHLNHYICFIDEWIFFRSQCIVIYLV